MFYSSIIIMDFNNEMHKKLRKAYDYFSELEHEAEKNPPEYGGLSLSNRTYPTVFIFLTCFFDCFSVYMNYLALP